jgi:hypothetical protein
MISLRVLSIIAFVWYLLWCLALTEEADSDELFGAGFLIFSYAIAHAIVAIVQGVKHNKTSITVMSIIAFIWYILAFICISAFMEEDYDAALGWVVLGVAYAVAFTIVTLVQSFAPMRS